MTWVSTGGAVSGGAVTTSPYASAAEVASLRAMIIDLTSIVVAADGTQSAPSHSFLSEKGTGLYRAGAGDLRFAVLGLDRLRVGPTASAPAFTFASPQAAGGVQPDFLFSTSANRSAGLMLDIQNNSVSKLAVQPTGDLQLRGSPVAMWQRVVATADTSNSTTLGGTDIAGLSFSCASGKKYLLRAVLWVYAAATTTGHGISAKSTGAPTTSTAFFTHEVPPTSVPSGPAEIRYSGFADTPTASGETSSASSGLPGRDNFHGYLVTTGAGTFRLRLITEVNASAVTVKAGSYLEWMETD